MRELEAAFRRWQGECGYCGAKVQMRPGKPLKPVKATRDHFIPRTRGGGDGPRNIVLACDRCNTQKGGLDPRRILKVWLQIDPSGLADQISRLLETTQPLPVTADAQPALPLFDAANTMKQERIGGDVTTCEPPH